MDGFSQSAEAFIPRRSEIGQGGRVHGQSNHHSIKQLFPGMCYKGRRRDGERDSTDERKLRSYRFFIMLGYCGFSHSEVRQEVILLLGVRPFAVFLGSTVVGESKGEGVMW
ncbi:MAG: hypothetical protein GY696_11945 [Gammaproteobacteria bacterium]|nr:hypothetical protein [Gammaproteobacteria bacterium]